ncbi:hypothetical protein ACWGXJ_26255 [Paenibacillus sp. S33]
MKYSTKDQTASVQHCPKDQIQPAGNEQVMRIAQKGKDKYRRTLDKLAKN